MNRKVESIVPPIIASLLSIGIIGAVTIREKSISSSNERENYVVSDKIMADRKKSIVSKNSIILVKDGIVQMTIPVEKVGQTCIDGKEVIVSWTNEKCNE